MLILDCGERPAEDERLWSCADLLCCACGGHAGDDASMTRVAEFCARSGVALGAHPSYPDRAGFGRRSPFDQPHIVASVHSLGESLTAQCRALARVAGLAGVTVTAVKPHGALYHDAAAHADIAAVVVDAAVAVFGALTRIVGPPGGALRDEAERQGLPYAREGFADRRLRPDGTLVPRDQPGALIADPGEAARQARSLLASVDVVCVHADTPGALEVARAVRTVIHH